MRLVKEQRRLSRFIEQSFATLDAKQELRFVVGQVSVYMLSVSLRVFEQVGGRMRKVTSDDISAATARIQAVADQLLPADGGFAARARAVEWRAQPNLLDEILWALFDRAENLFLELLDTGAYSQQKQEGEMDLPTDISALVYMILWASVEALDANWTPPKGWSPESGLLPGEDLATWKPSR